MVEDRARNYIERLPEIIARKEDDLSHLDPQMIEILYPERASKEFALTLIFSPPKIAEATKPHEARASMGQFDKAVSLAEKGRDYRCDSTGGVSQHRASFGIDQVNQLHALYNLVEDNPSCEILVNGKRVPLGRELWLPFFWFFVKDESA